MATQEKKGYLRGVRGILIIPLEEDGSEDADADSYWVDTAQEVGITAEVVAGESADLRGGDRLLVRVEEDDIVVGAELSFTDARFDAEATEIIAGGTLIEDSENGEIIGWESPTIEEQGDRKPFEAEVYVQSYGSEGGRESYLKYTFRFCKGYAPNITHTDQDWGTPEFTIKARENPATEESTYQKELVDDLPSEATE